MSCRSCARDSRIKRLPRRGRRHKRRCRASKGRIGSHVLTNAAQASIASAEVVQATTACWR
ncbi:hypothetical protein B296_00057884, partial [Ensete ventricosum]